MRIAVLADIHGNLAAFEAALAEVEKLAPDRLIIAGDVVDGGPDSLACWLKAKSLGCPILRGNHERYVYDFGTEFAEPAWNQPQFAPLHHAVAEMSNEHIADMAALPMTWRDPELPDLLVVHASTRSDHDSIFPHTGDELIDPMFAGVEEPLIVRGHNHHCNIRDWHHRRIVTTGSVGLSQEGSPMAHFAVLEKQNDGWHIRHRQLRYDVDATLRRFHDSGYLDRSGPVGRMFYREVATGTQYVVPFLRFYSHLHRQDHNVSLEAACKRFMQMGL